MQKKISFIIKASQEFFRHTEEEEKINAPVINMFFESISNLYIPLLNMLEKFETEGNNFCFSIVMPPVLCNLLASDSLQENYIKWLENKMILGQKELNRNKDNPQILSLIKAEIEKNTLLKNQFAEKYQKRLLPVFRYYMQKGMIEILGTCGTDIFLPHYIDLPEIISAEIETGLYSYKKVFGTIPEGFWICEKGYFEGLENIIKAYGYSYTIVDSRSFLLAENIPENGTYRPCRIGNFVFFADDYYVEKEIFGEKGFVYNKKYLNLNSDIGFDLDADSLSPVMQEGTLRFSTGYTYLNRDVSKNDGCVYDKDDAHAQVIEDAENFLKEHSSRLNKMCQEDSTTDFYIDVCTFDLERLSKNWFEFPDFFESIIVGLKQYDIENVSCSSLCANPSVYEKIIPYSSSGCGEGYGENLLSSKNSWMIRYTYKACVRMIDLAERFPSDSGLKNRLLNLGAQELLLSLSSKLADYIDESTFLEFAERRFKESIFAFTYIFDALGSNTVSTEWLTRIEAKDSVFPWMNYKIFAKKK